MHFQFILDLCLEWVTASCAAVLSYCPDAAQDIMSRTRVRQTELAALSFLT